MVVVSSQAHEPERRRSFEDIIARFPRLRWYVLPELRAAYQENPAGFEYVAEEVLLEARKPSALLVWRTRRGEHRLVLDDLRRHHHRVSLVTECAHGCGETVCIDDGKNPVLCLECRQQCGYDA
jgi:hypothetical protein